MTEWIASPSQAHLRAQTVDIWRIDLNLEPGCLPALQALLSSEEADQARRFHFERDRRRYLVSHAALRCILGGYLDLSPQSISFRFSRHGKPSLREHGGLYFNLAHSHELALVAVTGLGEVGVDIEHVRPLADMDSIARHSFSEHEYNQLQALPAGQRLQGFFRCWSRKEAFIKALGEGLSYPLQQFSVIFGSEASSRLAAISDRPAEAARWTLHGIDMDDREYAAAYAVRATGVQERRWQMLFDREFSHVPC